MTTHVLLNLLNELRKRDKMRGLMLDSIYHMTLKLLKNHIFGLKMSKFGHLLRNVIMDIILFPESDFIAWCYITPRRDIM